MEVFKFKQFSVAQSGVTWKVGMDSVLLGAWSNVAGVSGILDVGCGTGVLSLMAAQRNQQAKVTGIEIDHLTAEIAYHNFEMSPWCERLRLVEGNIMEAGPLGAERFEMIISNPPYFSDGLRSAEEQRNLARAGTDLNALTTLSVADTHLKAGGRVSLIVPYAQADKLIKVYEGNGWYLLRRCDVRHSSSARLTRSMIEFGTVAKGLTYETLILFQGDEPTEHYRSLISPFRDA